MIRRTSAQKSDRAKFILFETERISSLLGDGVVTAPEKLDEAKPVAERIGQQSEFAPFMLGDGLLQARAGRKRSRYRGIDFIGDEIEVQRRPVALVGSRLRDCR